MKILHYVYLDDERLTPQCC